MDSQNPTLRAIDSAIDVLRNPTNKHFANSCSAVKWPLHYARESIRELICADTALDVAQDALAEAKREKGSWRVNPLGHEHPAVLAVREAKERRRVAIARVMGIESDASN